nr:olfactory receptor 85 [Tropidothorax elegans]
MLEGLGVESEKGTVYDFLTEQKWYLLLAGYTNFEHGTLRSLLYDVYKALVFMFLAFLIAMAWTGAYLSYGNTIDTVQAIHMNDLAMLCFLSLMTKLSRAEWLHRTMDILRSGVYKYEDEPEDKEHERIKSETVNQIRGLTRIFGKFITLVACTNTAFVPLMNFFMIREDGSDKILNPYLPQPFYMPFDTKTFHGYLFAYVINALFMFILLPLVVCMDTIHLSCTLQLKAQFRILNYSIRNIEMRAVQKLVRNKSVNFSSVSLKDLNQTEEYQDSMYSCLRSNIQHHQAILRLNRTMEKYTGVIFFIVVCLASCVLASHLISVLENPPLYASANYLTTLACELLYTFHYCWYGEEVTTESNNVFYSLYNTPWFNENGRFKELLAVTMCNTRVPMKIESFAFAIPASLHTFNSIMTTMYQIMNVVRNSKHGSSG